MGEGEEKGGNIDLYDQFKTERERNTGIRGTAIGSQAEKQSQIRGTLRFLPQLEMRPSSNAPSPVESREAPPTSSFPGFSEPP